MKMQFAPAQRLRLLVVCALWMVSFSAQAFCGFFAGKADATLFNEASQVILARDGNRTVISMLNDYRGPLADFALVVPVPQVLEKGQVRIGDKRLFDRLDAYSAPRVAQYFDPNPCPLERWRFLARADGQGRDQAMAFPSAAMSKAERAQALGVTVEAAYTVGEYDIVMLSARQSSGLQTWLTENGYRMPAGASAALKPYVEQDMKFFVAKVNLSEQARTGVQFLRPLQFAYESEKFMLPIRLGMINADPNKSQDLIAYVLSREGRVESSNYRTLKLPTNQNVPPGITRDFNSFYKALFDHQALTESLRVVFTEYFWDMAWCDPCAADPLTRQELQQAGVFWLEDASADGTAAAMRGRPALPYGAQNALLTRLHVRYTPTTFPEDLMFFQTRDRQNWQTRYVVQQPFAGSLQQCRAQAAASSCQTQCQSQAACLQQCQQGQEAAIEQARRYYDIALPQRQQQELQNLSRLTGWSLAAAARFAQIEPRTEVAQRTWWQKLFGIGADTERPGKP